MNYKLCAEYAVIVVLWELRLVEFCYVAADLGLSFR
jgi:hypothetical protein